MWISYIIMITLQINSSTTSPETKQNKTKRPKPILQIFY